MKLFKIFCSMLLILVVLFSISACSTNNQNQSHRLQWWLSATNWDIQDRLNKLSGKDVVIAVVDTAIDGTHPDLKGEIIEQYVVDGVPDEKQFEHGTAVAGIICASPNNKDGALGIAVDAKILSIVISSNTEAQIDSLIKGIEYATTKKVDIINISAGIIENNTRLQSAIDNAYDAGITIVAASGDDLNGVKLYPASYENVISVNSIDSDGKKIYGDNSESIFLPGGNIVTTYSSKYEPKKYVSYTGTSMSAPMLTGIISLVLEQDTNISNKDILRYFLGYQNLQFDTVKVLEDFSRMKK